MDNGQWTTARMKNLYLAIIYSLHLALLVTASAAQPATVDSKTTKVITAADGPVFETIKTAKGMRVVSNEPGNSFSIEIKGKRVGTLPGGPLRFQVDGKYLEITLHDKAPFVTAANKSGLTDIEILEWHRQWYAGEIEKTFGAKLNVEALPLKLFGDKDVLKWSFPMPPEAGYKNLKRQAYLSIVKGDQILMLNSAWTTEIVEYKEISQLLWDTMRSLKFPEKPVGN